MPIEERLFNLISYGITYEAVTSDSSGVMAREFEGNRLFTGETTKYGSLNEELTNRIKIMERNQLFKDWLFFRSLDSRYQEVLTYKYAVKKPGGKYWGAKLIADAMGINRDKVRRLLIKAEDIFIEYYG